jgi:thiamine biosynthesis lipoprotein
VRRFVSRHHGLLGTVVELHAWAASEAVAAAMEDAAITEVERLQRVFNAHDETSNLRQWWHGREPSSPELDAVLGLATAWRQRSGGAFDPAVGALVELWDEAARLGRRPTDDAIARTLAAMRDPDDPRSRPSNLNAVAKGWIVDRCLEAAVDVEGARGMTVNAGGDLLHRAPEPLVVGVEDPARPYDNAPPLVRVELADGAIATSGGARRGWRIGRHWYSHVIDPRSGIPVEGISSASVWAADAATADVVATVLSVVPVAEGLAFVDGLDDVGCCIVTGDGELHRDRWWVQHELAP